MKPDAWLIDLDGTLVDTLGDFVAAWARVCGALHLPPADAVVIKALIGRGGERLVRDLLDRSDHAERFDEAWPAWRAAYAAVNGSQARAYPGVEAALARLSTPLACVTNKPQPMAEALLQRLDLHRHFQAVVGQREGLRAKPHPDAFVAAAGQLGLAASRCGVIGDSRNDLEAARAAGCARVLLLRHGYNHGEPVDAAPADAHLDDWPALVAWLSACPATGP